MRCLLYRFLSFILLSVILCVGKGDLVWAQGNIDHAAKAAALGEKVATMEKLSNAYGNSEYGSFMTAYTPGSAPTTTFVYNQKYYDELKKYGGGSQKNLNGLLETNKIALKMEQQIAEYQTNSLNDLQTKYDDVMKQERDLKKQRAEIQKQYDGTNGFLHPIDKANLKEQLRALDSQIQGLDDRSVELAQMMSSKRRNESVEAFADQKAVNASSEIQQLLMDEDDEERVKNMPGASNYQDFDRVLAYSQASYKHTFPRTVFEYMYEYEGACWFCPVFESIFDAINALATTVFNNMAKDFLNLMGIGILFFILFKVGKMVVSLQEVDLIQFLNDLLGPLGRAIFASALLGVSVAATDTVFTMITNPVIDVSVRLGQTIMRTSVKDVQSFKTNDGSLTELVPVSAEGILAQAEAAAQQAGNRGNKVLDDYLKVMLTTWMKGVSSSFLVGIAMGGTFMKVGLSEGVIDGFSMMVSGFFLWLCFWIIYLTFPFKLIDAFVQWAFVLTLMPLWIVLWVFPATRGYTKKAWEMFLNSAIQFVALSVMIALVVQLVDHIVPATLTSGSDMITRSEFFTMLMKGEDTKALGYAGFGSGIFMNTIAFCAMSFGLLSAASKLASAIAGGGANLGVGSGMTAPIVVAGKGAQAVGNAAVATSVAAWGLGGKIGSAIKRRSGGGSSGGSNGSSGSNETSSRSAPLGTYDGGSSGSGDRPPVVVQGPKGDKGDKGDKGENADQAESRGGSPSSGGSYAAGGSSSGSGLSHMTSEEKKVVESMAQKPNSVSALKNLSEDIAFIEELKAKKLDKDSYKQAIDGHQWKTENQAAMKHFAEEAYVRSDKHMPSLYGDTVAGALKEQNVVKLRTDLDPITERMRSDLERGTKVSVFLADLSDSVKHAGG